MKWRKYKKHFKKDILPALLGSYIGLDTLSHVPMRVTGVKVTPAGGNKATFSYTVEPYDRAAFEESRERYVHENGYDLTFEIPDDSGKMIKKLFGY